MSSSEIEPMSDPVKQMAEVGTLFLKGHSLRRIANDKDLPYATVKQYLSSWKDSLSYSEYAAVKAQDAVFEADQHYNLIKEEAWGIAERSKKAGTVKDEVAALSLAMNSETRRVEMLAKAGMLENAELANKMLETERKQDILADIIRNSVCPSCKTKIRDKMSEYTGRVEPIG